jgi:energy-coupling factor transporter ATP-binding protein EcfA2
MTLLELEHVGRRYERGAREDVVLRDVSLQLEAGELVAVWGRRRSGRSTLLRVAAGIEPPDSGVVRFDGRELTGPSGVLLGSGIGYCRRALRPGDECVLDRAMAGLLGQGVTPSVARSRARAALGRAGVGQCAAMRPNELDPAEVVRVSIARVVARRPKLLVIDEPTLGVELVVRDEILLLLRSLADEGIAVLMSASETTDLSVADRGLALDDGELRGSLAPKLAPRDELAERRRSASA